MSYYCYFWNTRAQIKAFDLHAISSFFEHEPTLLQACLLCAAGICQEPGTWLGMLRQCGTRCGGCPAWVGYAKCCACLFSSNLARRAQTRVKSLWAAARVRSQAARKPPGSALL